MTNSKDSPLHRPENSCISALIKAAKNGDVVASGACLYLIGQSLLNNRTVDSALAQFVGERLTNAVMSSVVSTTSANKSTTKERAFGIARSLGLIARRRGPRTSRFEPFLSWFYLASLVVDFHENKGHPLTREKDGAFLRAAQSVGCSASKAEAAYRRLKKNKELLVAAREGTALAYHEMLKRIRSERRK